MKRVAKKDRIMKQDKPKPKQTASLRKQAEKALASKAGKIRTKPAKDMEKLVHELQVHQIELEMQNDELRKAQGVIEESRAKYFELYDLAPVGYFTLDQKGVIREANLSGATLLNTPRSVLLRKLFFPFVLPESRDTLYTHLKKVFATGARQTCELKLMRKDGPLSVLLESIAITGEGANFTQCLSAVSDITEQKRAEEIIRKSHDELETKVQVRTKELQESEAKYRSLFANMISGFAYHQIVVNKKGKPVDFIFLEINDAFEKLTGMKREDIIGKRVSEIIPGIEDDSADWIGKYGKVALTGKETTFENYSEALKKWFSVSAYSPQKGFFVSIFDDITDRKRVEEALRENEERLRLSQQAAYVGMFDWDIQTDINIWTPELEAMYGLKPGEFVKTQGGWEQLVHPEDRDEAVRKVELAFQTGEPVKGEWRVIWPDGSVHWLTGRWQVFKDKAGRPLRMTGVNLDITERKQKEEELHRLNRTLKALGKSSKAMMRARNESEYLNDVCRIIVEDCGHAMVWIGFAKDDEARTVRPVAYAGFDEGYIKALKITWADTPRGRGPTGTAIRTGQPSICRNMQTDPLFKPWREEAIKRGYASSVVVPLMDSGKALGAINIYSREPDPFTEDEVDLLTELADDLSYGISSIRLRAAHDRTAEAVRQSEEKLRKAKDDLEIRVHERTLELKNSEHKYRMLVEQAADGIVLLDRKLNIVDINKAACEMTGFTCEELLKLNAKELYPLGELEEHPLRLDEVLSGETVITERRAVKKDGSLIEVEISAKLIEGGQIQAIVRDITERKNAERRSHLITELLELFARKASRKDYLDSVVQFLHDWTGCRSVGIRVVNKERYMPYDSYTGFSEEFMRKENMISLNSDACACIRVVSGKFEPQDAPAITPNGSFRLEDSLQFADQLTEKELSRFRGNCIRSGYASIAVIPIRYHDQPLGAIHLADEKKSMVTSDAIQFLESMAAPLIGEAIYRFSAEEELSQHRNRLEEIVKERTRELHDIQTDLNRAQTVAHTGSWRLDVRKNELLWSDENWRIFGVPIGTALTYETFLSTIHPDDREYVDKQWKAALQGEPYDIEHRIVVDGQVKWVREKAELEFDADGTLKGGFGTTQDITEKKQVERDLQTLMEELKRSNSDLEQFAYAASHDLQEPLRVVAGFVSLLEKRYKEKLDDKAHEFIEYAVDGVKRMQVLIKDLLAYSQVGTKGKTFKPTFCSVALEQAIYNLHTAIEESGAEITYDSLPTVSADTSQLTRLFQNLIGNAIKFRGEERLKIHIASEQKGNEWVFSIRDNGIGIDPKFFGRIFVVFQRLHTREEYEGTGIGLAVCKKIVERHGGHIWVESEQGKGTTFYFTMPVME